MMVSNRKLFAGINALLLLVAVLVVSACTETCPECTAPSESVNEINMLGVTINTEKTPFPDTIERRLDTTVEPSQIIGEASMFFSPKAEDAVFGEFGILNETLESSPYYFTFLYQVDETLVEIERGSEVNMTTDSVGSYSGNLRRYGATTNLHGEGDHTLTTDRQLRIPITATHVRLWYQDDEANAPEVVRTVALQSLVGWRRYYDVNTL